MPDGGYYAKRPRPEGVAFLIKALEGKDFISSTSKGREGADGEQVYTIYRPEKGNLTVLLTNTYIVGVADAHEILADHPGIEAIVTMSSWNGYTKEAKAFCKDNDVGLFKLNEFLGAVYYSKGEKFVGYTPPKRN